MALSGCANFPDWQFAKRDVVETPATSDRFPLPADGSDVIGSVQVTIAYHQDTLHDIARRYELGYEEIVATTPGVDPWLPGEGAEVVLPTQFVLPNGSREGLVLNLASAPRCACGTCTRWVWTWRCCTRRWVFT